jgi:hypothetical protein
VAARDLDADGAADLLAAAGGRVAGLHGPSLGGGEPRELFGLDGAAVG